MGETLGPGLERAHFAALKPDDLDELMSGFIIMLLLAIEGPMGERRETHPTLTLVAAAVVSFAFDFLHPFSDGKGRIHRVLVHHVLARRGFVTNGIILPVSAVILNRPREYDYALKSFSKPLMERVEYTLDDRQRMTATNDMVDFYRYIDCTELTRITIDFIRETIETEVPGELRYLTVYNDIRAKMRDIIELPDRIAGLFVTLVRKNSGKLSKWKRELSKSVTLTADEIEALEEVVCEGLAIPADSSKGASGEL